MKLWYVALIAWLPSGYPVEEAGIKTFWKKADCIAAELEWRKKYKVPREPCQDITEAKYKRVFSTQSRGMDIITTFDHRDSKR